MSRPDHEDASIAQLMQAPLATQAEAIAQMGLVPSGLLILMSPCEQQCFFCAQPAVTHPPRSDWTPQDRIDELLNANADLGLQRLLIGGTEPTTHPSFALTLKRAQSMGFQHIELMTSGTRLADPGVATEWFDLGIRAIASPIYGRTPEAHDGVTGVPTHRRLLDGFDAATAAGIQVHTHTLALRRTLPELSRLAALCLERWNSPLTIAPARPKPGVWRFEQDAPSLEELIDALGDADPHSITLTGWPHCILPQLPRASADIIRLYFLGQSRQTPKTCSPCSVRTDCPGVVDALVLRDGSANLRPL